jgi:hypothetical protein
VAAATVVAEQEEEEEESFDPADMAMLRLQAPLLKQHRSPLHGWGMFAGQAIPRDAFVIEYTGEVVPNAVADQREKRYEAEGTGTMYLFRLDARSVIDATLKVNSCWLSWQPSGCAAVGAQAHGSSLPLGGAGYNQPLAVEAAACLSTPMHSSHPPYPCAPQGGAARYINHSCAPNCYTRKLHDIHTGRRCIGIFAGRDIGEGEELTYNYHIEEEPDGEPLPCHCGAPHCTGRMN